MLSTSSIIGVSFSVNGTEDVENNSWVKVSTHELFKNNTPYPNGVCDGHLGTIDHVNPCQTCSNGKKNCIGHSGNTNLNYPVINPITFNDAKKWLRTICHVCGYEVVDESLFKNTGKLKRLDEAQKIARTKTGRKCPYCKSIHPNIKEDKNEPLLLLAEYYDDKKKIPPPEGRPDVLYPHIIQKIFERIPEKVILKLGRGMESHPKKFILNKISIPTVVIRPDIKKIGGGNSTNDPLTSMLQYIIKKNTALSSKIPDKMDKAYIKSIMDLNNSYYDFILSKSEDAPNSISSRLKGKGGRLRKNALGKRTRNMCRGTITGDPTLRIDEVGVPLSFARTVEYHEVVQEYNKAELLTYVQNGRKQYPGAVKVIKKNNRGEYDVDSVQDIELENGDIVVRDMLDGDIVDFGRQPSLTISNLSAMRAKVTRDPNIQTLRMNVIACKLFNADFKLH